MKRKLRTMWQALTGPQIGQRYVVNEHSFDRDARRFGQIGTVVEVSRGVGLVWLKFDDGKIEQFGEYYVDRIGVYERYPSRSVRYEWPRWLPSGEQVYGFGFAEVAR